MNHCLEVDIRKQATVVDLLILFLMILPTAWFMLKKNLYPVATNMMNVTSKYIWYSKKIDINFHTSLYDIQILHYIYTFWYLYFSTCNLDKDDCDLSFKRCLYGYCKGKFGKKKKPLQYLDRQKCKLKAKLFYVTVVGVGCQAYRDAQKNACQCVRILERESSRKNGRGKSELWCDIF